MPEALELRSAELVEGDQLITRLREILDAKKEAGSHEPMPLIRQDEEGHVILSKGGSLIVPKAVTDSGLQVPDVDSLRSLVSARGMDWKDDYKERAVPYFASDERVDGHGDIVRQSWLFDEFEKNSPMPYSHEWWAPPVGRAIDWRIVQRADADYEGPALWLLSMFATKDDWDWADTIFRLVKSGFLVSGSVGFWSAKVIDVKDEDERAELGLGRWGLIFEQNHLLEYSPTTIPANSGAHAIARSLPSHRDELLPHDVTMLRELVRQDVGEDRKAWIDAESAILQIARSIWPDEDWTFHRELDVPLTLTNPPVDRPLKGSVSMVEKEGEEEEQSELEEEVTEQIETDDGDVSARLGRIEEAVDHIARRLDEFTTETSQVFGDLRELLETSASEGSGKDASTVESAKEGYDRMVRSMETALANLRKLKPKE